MIRSGKLVIADGGGQMATVNQYAVRAFLQARLSPFLRRCIQLAAQNVRRRGVWFRLVADVAQRCLSASPESRLALAPRSKQRSHS